ncbi:MAG: hypothetical protein M3367_10150 [Acidobacteriota bacterium]|nr:hypothetical protein [Acidobacteriota bacterium]
MSHEETVKNINRAIIQTREIKGKIVKDSIFKTYGVFIITFALMFYTFGAGMIDNYVIYPTFSVVGENEFVAFRHVFSPRIVALLVVPLILRFVFSVLLLWLRPKAIHLWHVWLFLFCQIVSWISTFAVQLPIQFELDKGKNPELIQKLIDSIWLRTTMNIACAAIMIWMMFLVIRSLASGKNETV